MGKPPPPKIVIHVYGAAKVGKYSLASMFTWGWIREKQESEVISKIIKHDKLKYEIEMKISSSLPPSSPCDGLAVIYSLCNLSSFETLKQQESNIKEATNPSDGKSIPLILLANKVDEATLSRKVQEEEGKILAEKLSSVGFFEVGATCNANVQKAFLELILRILNSNPHLILASKSREKGCNLM